MSDEKTTPNVLDIYLSTSFSEEPTVTMTLYFRGERQQLTRDNLIQALAKRVPGLYGRIASGEKQDVIEIPLPASTNHELDYMAVITALDYMYYISNRKMSAWKLLDEINIFIPASLTVAQVNKFMPDNADYDKAYNTKDEKLLKWLGEFRKKISKIEGKPVLHYLPRAEIASKF